MNLLHHELNITEDNPFDNCRLNRKPYADVLTHLIKTYSNGFVMAIDNEWGTGKTTFIKMWQHHLKNEGYKLCGYVVGVTWAWMGVVGNGWRDQWQDGEAWER